MIKGLISTLFIIGAIVFIYLILVSVYRTSIKYRKKEKDLTAYKPITKVVKDLDKRQ